MDNPYATLEVAPDASLATIKAAYRRLALLWHPDKNPDRREEAERRFKAISAAYSILSDPQARAKHDTTPPDRSSLEVFRAFFGEDDAAAEDAPAAAAAAADEARWEPLLVGPEAVFNLPLFEGPLLIDLRPSAAFARRHIVSSLSLPLEGAEGGAAALAGRLAQLLTDACDECGPPSLLATVVFVCDPTDVAGQAAAGAAALRELLASAADPAAATETDALPTVAYTLWRLRNGLRQIWAVRSGFDGFGRLFPALCGATPAGPEALPWWGTASAPADAAGAPVDAAGDVVMGEAAGRAGGAGAPPPPILEAALEPMPHYVLPSVYLGSRAVPHTAASLGRFGVSHVLVEASFGCEKPGTPWATPRLSSLTYHDVPLAPRPDGSPPELPPLWEAGAAFIEAALQGGGAVLVQVEGRSRSAAFVLWWLSRRLRLPVRAAALFLRDACPLIDWRLASLGQMAAADTAAAAALPSPLDSAV